MRRSRFTKHAVFTLKAAVTLGLIWLVLGNVDMADTLERARIYARRAIDALAAFPAGKAKAALAEAAEFAVARAY